LIIRKAQELGAAGSSVPWLNQDLQVGLVLLVPLVTQVIQVTLDPLVHLLDPLVILGTLVIPDPLVHLQVPQVILAILVILVIQVILVPSEQAYRSKEL
jgi:hypothetical protein